MTQASLVRGVLQTYIHLTEAADIYQSNQSICRCNNNNNNNNNNKGKEKEVERS